jgi:hypothetical protein
VIFSRVDVLNTCFLETGSCYVIQVGFELVIFLPQSSVLGLQMCATKPGLNAFFDLKYFQFMMCLSVCNPVVSQ